MEKKEKKDKQKLKSSQKRIIKPKEDEPKCIRSVYFDLEGDLVYNTINHIRSYVHSGKIPEEEMLLVWPILKTKSLLFLQTNAHQLLDESSCLWLKEHDPFVHNDPKLLSIISTLKSKPEPKYNIMRSIWTTKEEYIANFQPASLSLFSEYYFSSDALKKLKNQPRTPLFVKAPESFAMFSEMPSDLIWCIISYLTHPIDIVNVSKCSKLLHEVCSEPLVWNRMCQMYGITPRGKNVKKSFAAHYLRPAEQIMYSHQDDNFKYCHIVIPPEELRVVDYSILQQKYMLDDITTFVLVVNMLDFDKKLESYKYNSNYILENIGFLEELIQKSAQYHQSYRCAFVVQLVDSDKQAFNRIGTCKTLLEHFPDLPADRTDPKEVLQHIVIRFKMLSFIVANSYTEGWKPELIVQYENSSNVFFVDNYLRILRHVRIRPIPDGTVTRTRHFMEERDTLEKQNDRLLDELASQLKDLQRRVKRDKIPNPDSIYESLKDIPMKRDGLFERKARHPLFKLFALFLIISIIIARIFV